MPSIESQRQPQPQPPLVVQLARRWVVDYFNRHDSRVCQEFITPDYALRIGEYTFAGRDTQWLPAVQKQMDQFPGMGMTVHQVITNGEYAAVYFTEHGASGGVGGPLACWSGVAIYHCNGQQLDGCVAQEDYMTRSRQLKSGVPDTIAPPAVSPWDTVALPVNQAAMEVVRQWLQQPWPCTAANVQCDDEHITGAAPLEFEVQSQQISVMFSSGAQVAFHTRQTGLYRGGFAGVAPSDQSMVLHCNGIVEVRDGSVVGGRVIRNRPDLRAALLKK